VFDCVGECLVDVDCVSVVVVESLDCSYEVLWEAHGERR
jgi:hypothetical protein